MMIAKHGIRLLLLIGLCSGLATACNNPAQKQDSKDVANDKNDIKFDDRDREKEAALLVEVVATNYECIQLSALAAQKSARPEVKTIADSLGKAHTALLEHFKAWAVKRNISLPGETTKEAKEEYTRLAELPQQEFDRKWCELLLEKHRKIIADMESAVKAFPEEDVKTLLSESLSPLREQNDKLMQYHHQF